MKNPNERRQIRFFTVTDCTAMEEYLEEMASKGWALKTAGGNHYVFKKTEPQKLRYAVALFPKASAFGGAPNPALQEYIEYCAAAGWRYICTWSVINIFVAENDGVPPIETDEAGKLQLIISSVKKLSLSAFVGPPIMLFTLLNGYFFNFQTSVVKNYFLILLPLFPLTVLLVLFQTVTFRSWCRRQRARLNRGEPLRFYSLKAQQKRMKLSFGFSLGIISAIFAASITFLLLNDNWLDAVALLALFVFVTGIILLTLVFGEQIHQFIAKKPLRLVTFGAGIVIILSALCVIGAIVYVTVTPVPAFKTESSVLASKTELPFGKEDESIIILKSPYEWVCQTYLRRDPDYSASGQPGNTAVWDADAVVTSRGKTFVIYDDCIISFEDDLSLTDSNIAMILQNAGKSSQA